METKVKVSEIQIFPVKPKDGLIGFASFLLDGKYYVGSVAIYTRLDDSSYRLVYPTKKIGLGNLHLFYPVSREVGQAIEHAVSEKSDEILSELPYA